MNKIIIAAELVSPPTWFASFRDFTLYSKIFFGCDVLLECRRDEKGVPENPDPYWKWIRPRGGMDFVDDFVPQGLEDGYRIDTDHQLAGSRVIGRFAPENVHQLIEGFRRLRDF